MQGARVGIRKDVRVHPARVPEPATQDEGSTPGFPNAAAVRNRKGFLVEELAKYFEDWDALKRMYDIRTNQPIDIPVAK